MCKERNFPSIFQMNFLFTASPQGSFKSTFLVLGQLVFSVSLTMKLGDTISWWGWTGKCVLIGTGWTGEAESLATSFAGTEACCTQWGAVSWPLSSATQLAAQWPWACHFKYALACFLFCRIMASGQNVLEVSPVLNSTLGISEPLLSALLDDFFQYSLLS